MTERRRGGSETQAPLGELAIISMCNHTISIESEMTSTDPDLAVGWTATEESQSRCYGDRLHGAHKGT
jgi:hypothetical protein